MKLIILSPYFNSTTVVGVTILHCFSSCEFSSYWVGGLKPLEQRLCEHNSSESVGSIASIFSRMIGHDV